MIYRMKSETKKGITHHYPQCKQSLFHRWKDIGFVNIEAKDRVVIYKGHSVGYKKFEDAKFVITVMRTQQNAIKAIIIYQDIKD